MNDYWNEKNELICGRCKAAVCVDDGSCRCTSYWEGFLKAKAEHKSVFKRCSRCSKEHNFVPGDARLGDMGIFWECVCTNTLFLPLDLMAKKAI